MLMLMLCYSSMPKASRKHFCAGVARKHNLRISGRRNALGSILGRRRCAWFSGTTSLFAAVFRSNTHTAPNYRVPLRAAETDRERTEIEGNPMIIFMKNRRKRTNIL